MAFANSQESHKTSLPKKQQISQQQRQLFSSFYSHTPSSLTIARNKKELFFGELGSKRQKLERRLDQERLRLATTNKRPLKKGWTYENFAEWLSKEQLLKKYGEWSLRGGKQLGNKYLSFLDVDIFKSDVPLTLQQRLEKKCAVEFRLFGLFLCQDQKRLSCLLIDW